MILKRRKIMKLKNKIILGFLIAAVLLGGLIFYKPAQEEFNFRRIDEEPELLESKTADVDGTSVRFDLYDDKGVKVQVAVPLSDEDDYKLDMEALAEAAEGLFETEETLKTPDYENTGGGTHQDCAAWHSGRWEVKDAMTPFVIRSTDMKMSGVWKGEGAAHKMQLHQSIEFSGAAADISVPPGFEKHGSTNTYTWSSFAYENTPLVLAYIGDAEATSVVSTLEMTVKSGADIYPTNSLSYSSSVSDSKSILGG